MYGLGVENWILQNEGIIRLSIFLGVFLTLAIFEIVEPLRARHVERQKRWPGNIGLAILSTLLLRVVFPAGAVGIAAYFNTQEIGILFWIESFAGSLNFAIKVFISVLLLDLWIYLQHRIFHLIPWLWKFHQVHHADQELDVTSGSRFHPIEILLSMGLKAIWIGFWGMPVLSVLIFEIGLNAMSMFNHANVALPKWLESSLRTILVTPHMHRIHHSIDLSESNQNFGFQFSFWDRLFHTYLREAKLGQQAMVMGVGSSENERFKAEKLRDMISMPWRSEENFSEKI